MSDDDLTMMRRQQRTRLLEVLGPFVRDDDGQLSDLNFVKTVVGRFYTALGAGVSCSGRGSPTQRVRLLEVLGRHVRAQDGRLFNLDFVRAVMERFERERTQEIVDVNE